METKKSIGFGFRGWLLIIVLFFGFMMFQVFTNYPLNILADFYGGAEKVAMLMTIGTGIGIVSQIVISNFIGKIKSIKNLTAVIGLVAVVAAFGVAGIPFVQQTVWSVVYLIENVVVTMYALFFLSIIAGQWFPTRKGTVMGIATIAYPVSNGVIGFFAGTVMGPLATGGMPAVWKGFLPFLILTTLGYILFLIFVTDYPEQCGALATATGTGALVVIALIFVAMFMGASSNFTVSVAAQYWRREDFSGVFACVNPVSNIFNAVAPTIVAILIASVMGVRAVFIFLMVAGIIGLILMLAFNSAHVKTVDDTYRKAAGKPLDDALVGRK